MKDDFALQTLSLTTFAIKRKMNAALEYSFSSFQIIFTDYFDVYS